MVRASGRWVDAVWIVALGIASSAWCLTAAGRMSATFDEPLYLNAGLTSWRTGSNKILMSAGTMPLPVDVQTLPLYLWERHRGAAWDVTADLPTILPVARAANLAFWWLLLAYAMRLGRTFGGAWGGRLAVTLIACEPNFLGHAALATTDIPLVACMLAFVYHTHHGLGRGWARRVLVPGVLFGVATLAKASGMVFGVQALVVLGLCHLAKTGALNPPAGGSWRGRVAHLWHACYDLRKDVVQILLIGFVLVFAYTGSDWGTERTFVEWADGLPDGGLKGVMQPLSRHLTIFPNAGEGLLQQVKHNVRGQGTVLVGEWHPRAHWSYFPVALTMKTPEPVVALFLAALLVHPRRLLSPPGWVALVLLAFSLNCRVQIGIRFMFTLSALASVALAAGIANAWADGSRRAVPRWFVAFVLAAQAFTAAWVWPHGLSYFNQFWGGPREGYRLLHDSNTDWGQGLPELRAWHRANGSPPLGVWYYGTDPSWAHPPFRPVPLHQLPVAGGEDVKRHAGPGLLAVSVAFVSGDPGRTPSWSAAAAWIRTQTPVARTTTFFIYEFRE
jgi:hypothetical protein